MIEVVVDSNAASVSAWLRDVFQEQVPFATALAINETAKDFQAAQRAHMRQVFTVRRPAFVDRAVKIKPFAKKRSLMARVLIEPPGGQARADILTKFEEGGEKRPTQGHRLAVPDEARRTKAGIVTASQRIASFDFKLCGQGQKARVFSGERRTFMILNRDNKTGGVYQRKGRGKGSHVVRLFRFTPSVRIPRELAFEQTARVVVQKRFDANFSKAFDKAVRTAR